MKIFSVALALLLAQTSAQAAERVVTLAPHLAEIVCAVGACAELVGVSAYSNYPEEAKTKPVIGDVAQLNIEALIALKPTQILAWGGGTPAAMLATMQRLKLPVKVIDIRTLEDVGTAIETIGARLRHVEESRRVANTYRARIDRLERSHRGLPKLKVFYQIETTPAYTINRDSPISQVIQLCGGINVFAGLPTLSAAVSQEAVLAARPEVVLHARTDNSSIESWWAGFPASTPAHQHLIFAIDGDWLERSGPRLADGAEKACAALDAARLKLAPQS